METIGILIVGFLMLAFHRPFIDWVQSSRVDKKVIMEQRKKFSVVFEHLVRDTQKLRQPQTTNSPERLALGRINGFKNNLDRAYKHLEPSVRQIAHETITTARSDYIEQSNIGDEFVDYLEQQYQKALKKKWGEV